MKEANTWRRMKSENAIIILRGGKKAPPPSPSSLSEGVDCKSTTIRSITMVMDACNANVQGWGGGEGGVRVVRKSTSLGAQQSVKLDFDWEPSVLAAVVADPSSSKPNKSRSITATRPERRSSWRPCLQTAAALAHAQRIGWETLLVTSQSAV